MPEEIENELTERELTPAMSQYYEIKARYPDTILFFRMGDFYEMFGPDAITASKILGIALTVRNKNSKNPVPLCGMPHHSYLPHLVKLLKAGKKVAICEQLEDARVAKGVVKRGVTRVITPATVVEEEALAGIGNNFLLSIYLDVATVYIVAADVSTGETYLKSYPADRLEEAAAGWSAKEVISNADIELTDTDVQVREVSKHYQSVLSKVLQHFGVTSEKALHIEDSGYIKAIGMVLDYLDDLILHTKLARPVTLSNKESLIIDNVAARTLEITENANRSGDNTLFSVLDKTSTPMGTRFLKNALMRPSRDLSLINSRLDIIEFLAKNNEFMQTLSALLADVYDIERITGRLISNKALAKDLVWLKNSLKNMPEIEAMISSVEDGIFKNFSLNSQQDLYNLIDKAIVDDPPALIMDGGIIRPGFNKTVDELRDTKLHSKELLRGLEDKERKSTNVNLKLGYNKVFGFFFEVSKANAAKMPAYFERKQTLVSSERFVTSELKELESNILTAEERLKTIEYELFLDIRNFASERSELLRELSRKIASLDFLLSLALCAVKYGYKRPEINTLGRLKIVDGRHPVLEVCKPSAFVPNDFLLDNEENRLLLITGPNMSGKSTYLRSAALIVIMAHIGSFVPAAKADIPITDRIFTRVGASDNLSRGESTFMVEMVETANILSNATKNSLIILDEIGRGTSTFDGISIAWSVAEDILNRIGAKTLFATHYHELTEIAETGVGAKNYTIDVKEWDGEVIFLRKVIPGTADKSYGIHVAKLAGLPLQVTERASEILSELEREHAMSAISHEPKREFRKPNIVQPILVFDDSHPVIEELKMINADNITPLEALQKLGELKKKAYL